MSKDFDPYYKWLGIPLKDRPPNHYRLLAIELFEADTDVISDAAEQRMAHVRSYQLGQYMALSQRILNELAAARACLLDPQTKAKYDRALRAKLAPPTPAAATPPMLPSSAKPNSVFDPGSIPSHKPRSKRLPPWMPLAFSGVGGVVVVAVLLLLVNSGRQSPTTTPPSVASPTSHDAGSTTATTEPDLKSEAKAHESQAGESRADQSHEGAVRESTLPEKLYLADLWPVSRTVAGPADNISRVKIRNTTPAHGLWAHPAGSNNPSVFFSVISFQTPKDYRYLSGAVGIASKNEGCPERGGSATPLTFRIKGNGRLLWQSRPMHKADELEPFSVDVAGIETLDLYVNCRGSDAAAWALWIDPVLTRSELTSRTVPETGSVASEPKSPSRNVETAIEPKPPAPPFFPPEEVHEHKERDSIDSQRRNVVSSFSRAPKGSGLLSSPYDIAFLTSNSTVIGQSPGISRKGAKAQRCF
jgi:hypothetical protein